MLSNEKQDGGDIELIDEDSTIDLPDTLEVVSINNESLNQDGGDIELIDEDSTIDLPDTLEVVTINNESLNQDGGKLIDEEDSTIDLPSSLEVVSIESLNQDGGKLIDEEDSTIDLPNSLEVVSLNQDGGFLSESSKDLFDSSIYLPNHVEVITLNRDEILESVDTDSSILDILDIKSKDTKSIGNLFMKNFKRKERSLNMKLFWGLAPLQKSPPPAPKSLDDCPARTRQGTP